MKHPGQILIVCFLMLSIVAGAQPTIQADVLQGCDSLVVNFSYTPSAVTDVVSWDFGNGVTSTNPTETVKYPNPGSYDVQLVVNSDTAFKADYIKVGITPSAQIAYRVAPNNGSLTLELAAVNVNDTVSPFTPYQFEWYSTGQLIGNTRLLVHPFDTAGIYPCRLIVSDDIGCRDTFERLVEVQDQFIVPNVFTPNGDNVNDLFEVNSNGKYFLSFMVFSKSGALVYKTEAKTIVWDGKSNSGTDITEGIYYYVIEELGAPNPQKQHGFIYIYR